MNYTYNTLLDLLNTEEKLDILLKKVTLSSPRSNLEQTNGGKGDSSLQEKQEKEVARLRDELTSAKKKVLDFETLKKQAEQQHTEFNRLADEHAALLKQADGSSKKDS